MDDETKLGIMILMSFVIFIFLLILIMKIMIHWGNSQQKELVIENKKKIEISKPHQKKEND